MTIADFIANNIRKTLQDSGVYWSDGELLRYIGEAYGEIVGRFPQAGAVQQDVNLTADKNNYNIPDALKILGVAGVKINTTYSAPVMVDYRTMATQNPTWFGGGTASDSIQAVVYEPDADVSTFWVYPKPSVAGKISLTVSKVPAATATTDDFALSAQYVPLVANYVLFRAYSKDGASGDANMATQFFNAYTNAAAAFAQAAQTIKAQ